MFEPPLRAERVGSLRESLVAPGEYDYWRTTMPYFEARDEIDESVPAFRDGYESVRSLPDHFEQRRPVYCLINWVAFIESLHLQKTVEPTKRETMSEWMRTRVFDTLEELRENRVINHETHV